MATQVGEATIKLSFDTAGMKSGLATASSKLSSLGSVAKTSMTTLAKTTTALVGSTVAGATALVGSHLDDAMSRLDTLKNYPTVMQSLGHSAADAQKSIDMMDKHLDGLPTTLNQSVADIQKLAATMGDLESATKVGLSLNDMFLAGGKGTEVASRAMEQYNQMLAIGKVDMQSWRSLVDAAPGQMNQLAESLLGAGANSMDLYNAMKEGNVTFEQLNEQITKLDQEGGAGFASFSEQAVANTQGLQTQLQNVKTSLTKVVADALSGNEEALVQHSQQLAERAVKIAPTLIKAFALATGEVVKAFPTILQEVLPTILTAIGDFVVLVAEAIPDYIDLAIDLLLGLQDTFFEVFEKIANALLPRLPEILGKIMNFLVQTLVNLFGNPKNLKILVKTLIQLAMALAKSIPQILPPLLSALPQIVGGILQAIAELAIEGFNGLMSTIAQPLANIGQWLIDHILAPVGAFFQTLFEFVKGIFLTAIQWFVSTIIMPIVGFVMAGIERIKAVVSAITVWIDTNIVQPIVSFFTGLWDTLVDGVTAAVGKIKAVWEGIKHWIDTNIVQPIASFFSGLWEGVKKGAEALGEGIGKAMSTIGEFVKAPINAIIKAINKVIDKINGLTVPDWVPGIGGSHTDFGHIPELARGGLVSGATNAIIGEAGAEAVIPLERNTENWTRPLATALAEQFQAQGIGGAGVTVYMTNNINNNLDADEIGQRLITSIRRAS